MALTALDYTDAVNGVINHRPLGQNFEYLFDPSMPRPWILMDKLMGRGEGKRWTAQGGDQIRVDVVYDDNNTAAFVYPDQTYQLSAQDLTAKATVPWRSANGHYVIGKEEFRINRGPEKLYDSVVKPKRLAALMGIAKKIENELFAPSDGSSDLNPLAIPYWVVPITGAQVTAATRTFQGCGTAYGVAPTTVGGMSTTTYTRWRNYNDVRTTSDGSWSDTDNDRLCWMFDEMQFTVPPNIDMLADTPFNMMALYTNRVTKTAMERRATNQNDNVGPDIARYHGGTFFKNIPITRVSALDTASATARGAHPVYLINWAYGHAVVRGGNIFAESTYPGTAQVPNLTTVHIDAEYNLVISNRMLFGGNLSYVAAA